MYKIYNSGREFLQDNIEIVRENPIATCFFELDSFFESTDCQTYAVKVYNSDKYLLALRLHPFPLMLFGDECLCFELAQIFVRNNWKFVSTLSYPQIGNAFLQEYEKLCGGSHQVKHAMDIMFCKKTNPCDTSEVRWATLNDAPQIAQFAVDFATEALGESLCYEERLQRVQKEIGSFAVAEQEDKIVSVAQRTREMTALCALSYVYTLPAFRNRGFSRKVVTFVTNSILADGKLPYLFVDKTNPISNHLYKSIGYEYDLTAQYEISYTPQKD